MRTVAPRSRRTEVAFASAALAAVLLGSVLALGSAPGRAAPTGPLASDVPLLVTSGKAVLVGKHNAGSMLRLNVGLAARDQAGLDDAWRAMTTPGNPAFGTHLTKAQYRSRYAPTDASVRAASSWLRRQGLVVTGHTPDNLLIHARGETRAVEHALGVAINDYRHGERRFYANDRAPSVPSRLGVRWISGLDNANVYRTLVKTRRVRTALNGLVPSDYRKAYDIKPAQDGSGLKIGFTVWGRPLPQSDFDGYAAATGTPPIVVNKGGNDGLDWIQIDGMYQNSNSDAEVATDLEIAHGIAPGSHLKYFLGGDPGNTTMEDVLNAAANANLDIVSNSWVCDNGCNPDRNMDTILQMSAAQGTNWFFGSGDKGAIGEAYPASSPYVVAVGGTSLILDQDGNWFGEPLWSGAGAGCAWNNEPWPTWQNQNDPNCFHARSFPDVVANANTPSYVYQGGAQTARGTSVSTPIWAAFVTAWNRNNILLGRPKVPFLPPFLWYLAEDYHASRDFHDVVAGFNGLTPTVGFDMASGWGSVDVSKLANNPVDLYYNGPTSGNDGDTLTLSVSLYEHFVPGDIKIVPLPGQTVLLAAAKEICFAVTDIDGDASCKVTLHANTDPPGLYSAGGFFQGDAAWAADQAGTPFYVNGIPTKVKYVGASTGDLLDETILAATLTDDGASPSAGDPIPAELIKFTVGNQSCADVTDGSGYASCKVTLPGPPGNYGVVALFEGDAPRFLASGDAGHAITLVKEAGLLSYGGPYKGDYHDPVTVSANFVDVDDFDPTDGKAIHFKLGTDSCDGTVAGGTASCSLTPSQAPGSYQLSASFAGDDVWAAATDTHSFTIAKEEAPVVFTPAPPPKVAVGADLALAGHVSEDGAIPLAGKTLKFTIGFGPGSQSCTTAPTNSSGDAGCKIVNVQQPEGSWGVTVHFSGDSYYATSMSSAQIQVYSAKQNSKSVRDSISLLIPHANEADRAKLQDAANKLADALNPVNWARDGDHLVPKRGDHVFDDEQGAVARLLELINRSGISSETLQPLVAKLVEGTKALADVAILDAVKARGNAGEISLAKKERAEADASFEARRITEGIGHLKLAWHHAEKAMGRL